MKKTAVVSCYYIHNYGSALQAYATQKALNRLSVDNETINVDGFISRLRSAQYKYILKSGIRSDIFKDRAGKAKNVLVKKFIKNKYTKNIRIRDKRFEAFTDKYINKSIVFSSMEELNKDCINKYHTVIVGSDQLWLPTNIVADYFTLSFVPKEINSIAYATSFGVASLPVDTEQAAKAFLPKIKHISVRESAGQRLVKNLIGREVPVVCDPTLLFTGEEWMDIQNKNPLYNEPYVFCYFIGSTRLHREFACKLADKTGCKIVALAHIDHYMKSDEGYADYMPYDIGPEDFLNLIRNATFVCTDSFHSTVFSILYKKNFFDFRRYTEDTKLSTNDRLDTLLNHLNISDRMLLGNEDIQECLDKKIDYDTVHYNLSKLREASYDYLIKALKDEGSTDL